MWTSSLSWRIEASGDPSELASEHLLPVQFTELLQRPSGRTPELRLMAAVLEDAIRSFCRCAGSRGVGINLGAFLSAFVCGTLGERVGWHWGFGSAAVGMLAGLALYVALRERLLGDIGRPPAGRSNLAAPCALGGVAIAALFALLHHAGAPAALATVVPGRGAALVLLALAVGWAVRFVARLEPNERGPTATIFVFMLFNAVFWLAFEQAGSSLNLFTDLRTNRMLGGFEVPTTWFQSVNAGLIFLLAPVFAGLWSWLGRRGRDPGQPVKIALGLGFVSLGYVFMVWAGRVAADPAVKASMAFVLATYF